MTQTVPQTRSLRSGGPIQPGASGLNTKPARLLVDRAARWTVCGGGVAVISAIFGILVFIVVEVAPLAGGATVKPGATVSSPPGEALAIVADEYHSNAIVVGADGTARVVRQDDGAVLSEHPLLAGTDVSVDDLLRVEVPNRTSVLAASTHKGQVLLVPVTWKLTFEEAEPGAEHAQKRVVTAQIGDAVVASLDPGQGPIRTFAVAADDETAASFAVAAQLADGSVALFERSLQENMFTGDVAVTTERKTLQAPGPLTALALSDDRKNLYGGTTQGELYWWRPYLSPEPQRVVVSTAPISELCLLIGGRSLVAGQEDGGLSVWLPVRQPDESFVLQRVRDFPTREARIEKLLASRRNRTFIALDANDSLGMYYSTSHRTLWSGASPIAKPGSLFLSPRADRLLLASSTDSDMTALDIENPHPEVSFSSLFGKVWYEGYPEPEHVWQSTGGTDDFEAKFGFMPLLVGTLKGTIYALLLAIPLAVLGAMYTSQFMHPRLQGYVKPVIEIMAALPSVILGFLAGLWLAPKLETYFPALLIAFVALPTLVIAAGSLWSRLPRTVSARLPAGTEAFAFGAAIFVGIWLAMGLSAPFEALVFGGNFQSWLNDTTGLRYDQRNAIVIGLVMGFAVIPIIFSIAEEAFSSVPRNLVAGSLALGATRWETVSRIVLPTASPGVFSAIMVGFGRAVGETIIVLMAAGNTPILDWNPFNGMRTLSANIAVEIPEAPHGDTLYRCLFLAALLLFVVTFSINTVADVIRQSLRKRYAEL